MNTPRYRLVCLLLLSIPVVRIGAQQPEVAVSAASVLSHLEQTIAWYRAAEDTANMDGVSDQIALNSTLRQTALRAVESAFDFARADAALIAAQRQQPQQPAAGTTQNFEQAAQQAGTRVNTIQTQISTIDATLAKAEARQRPLLEARVRELESELNLSKQVQQAIEGVLSAAGSSISGAGLAGQINDLERSIPEARRAQAPTAAPAVTGGAGARTASTPSFRPESAGLIPLFSEVIALNQTESQLQNAVAATDALLAEIAKLRIPLTSGVRSAVRMAGQLTGSAANESLDQIAADQNRIDSFTDQFRRLSTALVPLGEQQILVASVRGDLTELRAAAQRRRNSAARELFIRTAMIGGGILILLAISTVWRRGTFRYVRDLRRRRQLTLLRRVVIGTATAALVLLGFVSDFGSFATYAGFLTAGIAVALQNVLLAVVAYFFFIGRYGVKVGDLVTISGVTGNVIEIGLVRLYLIELAGTGPDMHPTGRIVVLSNSVLFQPAPLFKQMSGANYTWHRVAVTLAPETDIEAARTALTSAVDSVLAQYRTEIERNHLELERSVDMQMQKPDPDYHFRYTDTGLEFTAQYPSQFQKSAITDDKVIKALHQAIANHPDLHLAPNGGPKIV